MLVNNIETLNDIDFINGVTVLVDKPLEWTSFDVVNKIRYSLKQKLGIKKIKVGHAGTLDPLATGLLIIAIGKDTKLINDYQGLDKTYTGSMVLGATTQTYDAEYEPDNFFPVDHIDEDLLEESRKKFIGLIEQVPPKYSAVKIKGKSAYKLARKGVEFEIKKRLVNIYKFDFLKISKKEIQFEVLCQKGTYIRSLVNDFGRAIESGAYLSGLRRLKIGEYNVSDAYELQTLIKLLKEN